MSKVTDITGKIIDYRVKSSVGNLVTTDQDMGVITAVITEKNDEANSLYVGDVHIAGGYGFDSLKDKKEVEDLLASKALRDLLDGNSNYVPPVEEKPETGGDMVYINSAVNVHDTTIAMVNGELRADSWADISHVKFYLNNGDILYGGNNYQYKITDNIRITNIEFDYSISQYNPMKDKIYYTLNNDEAFSSSINLTGVEAITIIPDGITHGHTLYVNYTVPKSINYIDNKITYNIVFTDEGKTKYYYEKVCTIEFLFPMFISMTTDLSDIALDGKDPRCVYYEQGKELRLTLPNTNDPTYNYIWVPTIFASKSFSTIYANSNINVMVKLDKGAIRMDTVITGFPNIEYNRYKTPYQYKGVVSWIIK